MPKDGQRMARSDQYIEPQVKLKAVQKVRIWHILLNDVVRRRDSFRYPFLLQLLFQFLDVIYEEYSFSLACLARFDDHVRYNAVFALHFRYVTFELRHLMRYDPSLGVEPEVDRILILHLLQTISQVCFLCDTTHGWEMVHLLECLKLRELLLKDGTIVPNDVDVRMPDHLVALSLLSHRYLVLLVTT